MPNALPAMSAQPYARKRRNINLTANYTATADDDGCTFTNVGAAGAVQVTIPAGLPRGTKFRMTQTSTTQDIGFKFSGAERLRNSGATTTAGGAATFAGAGAASVGFVMEIERVDGPNGDYGVMHAVGAPTLT